MNKEGNFKENNLKDYLEEKFSGKAKNLDEINPVAMLQNMATEQKKVEKGKFTVNIPPQKIQEFKIICKQNGLKQNFIIEKLITQWIDEQKVI